MTLRRQLLTPLLRAGALSRLANVFLGVHRAASLAVKPATTTGPTREYLYDPD